MQATQALVKKDGGNKGKVSERATSFTTNRKGGYGDLPNSDELRLKRQAELTRAWYYR